MTQIKKLKHIQVKFLDHALYSSQPVTCVVTGFIVEDNPKYYIVTPWAAIDCMETFENNLEKIVILKSTIIKKRIQVTSLA